MIFIIPIIIGAAFGAISLAVADATQEENNAKVRHHKRVENDLIAKYTELQRQYYELQDKSKHEINELHAINKKNRSDIQAFIDTVQGLILSHRLRDELDVVKERMSVRPSHQLIEHYLDAVQKTNNLLLTLNCDPIKISHKHYDDLLISLEECKKDSSLSSNLLALELSMYFSLFELKRIEIESKSDLNEILLLDQKYIPNLINKIQEFPLTEEVLERTVNFIVNTGFEVRLALLNNLFLPMSVVNNLSLHQDDEVRESIAAIDLSQKPSEWKEQYTYTLERLSKDKSPKVRMLVANHFYTTFSTLMRLCEDPNFDIQKNVYQRLITIMKKDVKLIELLDLKILKIILKSADSQIVIANKDSINKNIKTLIENDLPLLMNILTKQIESKICSCTNIKDILKNSSKFIRTSIASIVNLPETILIDLSKDKEEIVRKSLLSNPSLNGEVLKNLARDNSRIIRTNVIYHPNFSASSLVDLSIVETKEAIEFIKRTYSELQKIYKQYKK